LDRRTSADDVFEKLHTDIVSLKLLPGARLSEVDVAKQFDVSRQPVREAFIRLHERFIRTCVEVECFKVACERDTSSLHKAFEKNLEQQLIAIEANRTARFHKLDYKFHELVCKAADSEFAFETILAAKSKLDRLCLLSLTRSHEMVQIQKDHANLYNCIRNSKAQEAETLIRSHLSRVINLLDTVRQSHPESFADD